MSYSALGFNSRFVLKFLTYLGFRHNGKWKNVTASSNNPVFFVNTCVPCLCKSPAIDRHNYRKTNKAENWITVKQWEFPIAGARIGEEYRDWLQEQKRPNLRLPTQQAAIR